jgi:FixJ family two-component response regulator
MINTNGCQGGGGMDSQEGTVHLIDDDAGVRDAVSRLLRSAGWKAQTFDSADDFVTHARLDGIGCIVLDIRMQGMSGVELHEWIREHNITQPVIFLSAHCDVPLCVRAMKHGAIDVLQKPADADTLLEAIAHAVRRHGEDVKRRSVVDEIENRLRTLSMREREVMQHVIRGRLNKQIAADLLITEKTVKVHRSRAMMKMRARSVAELVHMCDRIGLPDALAA